MANVYMRDISLATGIIDDQVDSSDSISIVEADSGAFHALQATTYSDNGITRHRYEQVSYATWQLAGGTGETSGITGPTGHTGATGPTGPTGA